MTELSFPNPYQTAYFNALMAAAAAVKSARDLLQNKSLMRHMRSDVVSIISKLEKNDMLRKGLVLELDTLSDWMLRTADEETEMILVPDPYQPDGASEEVHVSAIGRELRRVGAQLKEVSQHITVLRSVKTTLDMTRVSD